MSSQETRQLAEENYTISFLDIITQDLRVPEELSALGRIETKKIRLSNIDAATKIERIYNGVGLATTANIQTQIDGTFMSVGVVVAMDKVERKILGWVVFNNLTDSGEELTGKSQPSFEITEETEGNYRGFNITDDKLAEVKEGIAKACLTNTI